MSIDLHLYQHNIELWSGDLIRYEKLMRAIQVFHAMYESGGKTAKDILTDLKEGFTRLLSEADRFQKEIRDWPSYVYFAASLWDLIQYCEQFPDAEIVMI
jgi:hypothetical protein